MNIYCSMPVYGLTIADAIAYAYALANDNDCNIVMERNDCVEAVISYDGAAHEIIMRKPNTEETFTIESCETKNELVTAIMRFWCILI